MAVDVSIVSCKSYDAEECRTALTQALAMRMQPYALALMTEDGPPD